MYQWYNSTTIVHVTIGKVLVIHIICNIFRPKFTFSQPNLISVNCTVESITSLKDDCQTDSVSDKILLSGANYNLVWVQ